jgi:hypothetical protein
MSADKGFARWLLGIALGAGCLGAVGCTPNWHDSGKTFLAPYENGNLAKASTEAARCAKDGVPTDKVLFLLEDGAIQRAAGKLKESNAAFAKADELVGDYNQWPTVRVSEEAAAALTTVRNVNYRGYLTDLVMMNTYRALNDMELGDLAGARTALIRASFVQNDIAEKYANALAKSQEKLDAKKRDKNYDAQKSLEARNKDGLTAQECVEKNSGLVGMQAYSDFLGPWADYLQGVFFMTTAGDASDRERARVAFRRVAGMVPDNAYVAQDVAEAERVANGGELTPVTYVIFETGLAPERGQIQIPLPLFLVGNHAPSVVLYIPTIQSRDSYVPSLTVDAGGGSFTTQVVCDVDRVVKQEFKNQLPTLITRMVVGAVTKAAIDAATQQALKNQDASVQLIAGLGMFVYQAAMNQADLRTWKSLPKQFQVARVPTPADRTIALRTANGTALAPVQLPAATVNIVYVKSIRTGVPPAVRIFTLEQPGVQMAAQSSALAPQ